MICLASPTWCVHPLVTNARDARGQVPAALLVSTGPGGRRGVALVAAVVYRIVIDGGLADPDREFFGGYTIESADENTALVADLDQDGLIAALTRIQARGLELVRITRVDLLN